MLGIEDRINSCGNSSNLGMGQISACFFQGYNLKASENVGISTAPSPLV